MNNTTIFENRAPQQEACVSPVGLIKQPAQKPKCSVIEPNHYAVIALNSAGVEMRGWDFKLLNMAKTFADNLRQKHAKVEIWAQDEYAKTLARRVPGVRTGEWLVVCELKLRAALHQVGKRIRLLDRIRSLGPLNRKPSRAVARGNHLKSIQATR